MVSLFRIRSRRASNGAVQQLLLRPLRPTHHQHHSSRGGMFFSVLNYQQQHSKSIITRSFGSSLPAAASASAAAHAHAPVFSLPVSPHQRTHLIFGANTDVGKTIVSAGLVRASLLSRQRRKTKSQQQQRDENNNSSNNNQHSVHYIKPLQCGGSDEEFVRRYALVADNAGGDTSSSSSIVHQAEQEAAAARLSAKILFQWETPTSPHRASILERQPCSDHQVLQAVRDELVAISSASCSDSNDAGMISTTSTTTYIETAGGVLSPSAASPENRRPYHAQTKLDDNNDDNENSSNNNSWGWVTQGDLYQPLAMAPVILVGDGRLGGISSTLSALESLLVRGYDVAALVVLEEAPSSTTEYEHDNLRALREYLTTKRSPRLRNGAGEALFAAAPSQSMVSLPPIPRDPTVPLYDWFASEEVASKFARLDAFLQNSWEGQVADLASTVQAGERRENAVWWPGHSSTESSSDASSSSSTGASYVDRATGDYLQVIGKNSNDATTTTTKTTLHRSSLVDASASWWTHGVGHGASGLALGAAAAAGRYGHVSGNVIHAPAISLAQTLVGRTGPSPWADRVFFTDDGGSAAVEAAIKMGIKTYQKRMKLSRKEAEEVDWIVAAQEDCYHGDTLGASNVSEAYLDREHPWYQPKGLCLAAPTIGFRNGVLSVSLPEGMLPDPDVKYEFDSIRQVMDVEARSLIAKMKSLYKEMIEIQWLAHEHSTEQKIGSIILEPVLLGTGGMKFVDPLWQRAMVELAHLRNIPVIFDESTVGLYRLGVKSCREILMVDPDIAVFSKLLTGGVLPLGATVTKEEVFDAVCSGEIGQSLANGNTLAPNPVACVCGLHALSAYNTAAAEADAAAGIASNTSGPRLLFDEERTKGLSKLSWVEQSFTLGSVLTVTLCSENSDGEEDGKEDEGNSRADLIVAELKRQGILAQPFGDVVYIMTSPLTEKEECAKILNILHETIDRLSKNSA